MAQIEETRLPGVGVRHDFVTRAGARVGVVTHRSGYRELLVYGREDPDSCAETLRLEEDDSRALAEMLGGSRVSDAIAGIRQSVEGLLIDWLPIEASSRCVGSTIGDYGVRARTGVSIVAVVRGDQTFPAPGPDFRLDAGDTAVVVGTAEGIKATFELLQGS